MSDTVFKTIVVHAIREEIETIRMTAIELFGETMVSPVLTHLANGCATFMVIPDGSSLGWRLHENADAARASFREYLRKERIMQTVLEWYEIHSRDVEPHIAHSSNTKEE